MQFLSNYILILLAVFALASGCENKTEAPVATETEKAVEVEASNSDSTNDNSTNTSNINLQAQLEQRQAEFAKMAPAELIAAANNSVDELAASGIVEQAIGQGDKAPDFVLPDALGNEVTLYEQLKNGPVILTWYRGSWCPYCNLQLHDYQKSLGDIHAAGAQLIAVSPELPDSALSWKEKNEMQFKVLSDVGNNVARDYGVVYKIPDVLADFYGEEGRIHLAKFNGDESLELPLAVTYVIDTDGTVEYAYVNADYRKRAETSDIVDVVTQMAANR